MAIGKTTQTWTLRAATARSRVHKPSHRPNRRLGTRFTPEKGYSTQPSTNQRTNALPIFSTAFSGLFAAAAAKSIFKRIFRRRPAGRPALPRSMARQSDMSVRFSCATFNLRGISDRWRERRPLLKQCLQDMDADVYCFQECLTGEFKQESNLLPPSYHISPCKSALSHLQTEPSPWYLRGYASWISTALSLPPLRTLMTTIPTPIEALRERLRLDQAPFRLIRDLSIAPFFGNSVACRLANAQDIRHSTLLLGDWRSAQRIEFEIPIVSLQNDDNDNEGEGEKKSGRHTTTAATTNNKNSEDNDEKVRIWVINTHLDHAHPDTRSTQASTLLQWAEETRLTDPSVAAIILCGDFNAPPTEVFHSHLKAKGYRSAHCEVHGREPKGTWPTGIQAPLADKGAYECLDYVYVWEGEGWEVGVVGAEVWGDRAADGDETLFPSDHAAVKATFELRKK